MREYILEYRKYGKNYTITIRAYSVTHAMNLGKHFIRSNYLSVGWIITPNNKKYLV